MSFQDLKNRSERNDPISRVSQKANFDVKKFSNRYERDRLWVARNNLASIQKVKTVVGVFFKIMSQESPDRPTTIVSRVLPGT